MPGLVIMTRQAARRLHGYLAAQNELVQRQAAEIIRLRSELNRYRAAAPPGRDTPGD
jgi:hypothetical protein